MAESRSRSGSRNSSNGQLSAKEAVGRVREDLPQLLGRPVESVLGVERDDDKLWQVTVQVLELARVPNSTDVLGCYRVTLEADGEIAGYQRQRRYTRAQADED